MLPSSVVAWPPIGHQLTESEAADGSYISWCEHIIDSTEIAGFELTGSDARSRPWPRLILSNTRDRGSCISVFDVDLDGDSQAKVIAANKGVQCPDISEYMTCHPVAIYSIKGEPLKRESWQEQVLGRYSVPQNSELVDLDDDGDFDIVVVSRGGERITWFENLGGLNFQERAIGSTGLHTHRFNMDYADLKNDGRLGIVSLTWNGVAWLQQPPDIDGGWIAYNIDNLFARYCYRHCVCRY